MPASRIYSYLPQRWLPYAQLARLDRPIGAWLLLFPCWWALALGALASGRPYPNPWYMLLFLAGALVMRAAGCTYNDFIDRDIDGGVARTASRPLPSGRVSPKAALLFAAALSLAGLVVLLQFNSYTIYLGLTSLLLVAVYPFMKRFTYWPQLVLGLTFNWGALVGWSAARGALEMPALLLYAGCICWTIGYDTIYAHQDKEDDLSLGLKSTALKFGDKSRLWIGGFYLVAGLLWVAAAALAGGHPMVFVALGVAALQLGWQVATLDIDNAANCLQRFRSNQMIGWIFFVGIILDMALSGGMAAL